MRAVLLESFGRAAPVYERHAHVQAALADWLGEWVPTERTGRALEAGAGTGVFTVKLQPWGSKFLATDVSPTMCAMGAAALPRVAWGVMSAEAPLPGPWDWIFSSGMLQWLDRPEGVFAAWRRSLRIGGRVLGGMFVAESLPELQVVTGGRTPLVWRTPEQWRRGLASAGLRLLRDDSDTRTFTYSSAREFLRTLHGVGAAPERRFTPAQLRRVLRDYEARFGGAGGVRATWTFYRFEAERPIETDTWR